MIHADALVLPSSDELASCGVKHLKRYWWKHYGFRTGALNSIDFHDEVNVDTILLGVLGLGLEQALKQIYQESATFEDFEAWVLALNNGVLNREKVDRFNALLTNIDAPSVAIDERVLSEEDMAFFHEHGYIILRNAVPKEDCDAAIKVIADFISIDISDPKTWYAHNPARQGIMVQLFQHPVLQKNRDSVLVRKAYEQLWNRKDIWVNTDRVGFNPPETETWKFPGPRLHWDVSLDLPIPFGLQGILYLSDTQPNQGAFTLVPGFQNRIEDWINSLPPGTDPRMEDMYALGHKPIAANAGDFIIWHQALPHGSSPNTSTVPRIVQYVNYQPINRNIRKKWL